MRASRTMVVLRGGFPGAVLEFHACKHSHWEAFASMVFGLEQMLSPWVLSLISCSACKKTWRRTEQAKKRTLVKNNIYIYILDALWVFRGEIDEGHDGKNGLELQNAGYGRDDVTLVPLVYMYGNRPPVTTCKSTWVKCSVSPTGKSMRPRSSLAISSSIHSW